ncbi:MAG: carbamoyltransferase N-terminal domain-containing protein [Calditrichia bacterium]
MNILGISAFYHDSAPCLVRDGEIIAAAQEERFTRKSTITISRKTLSIIAFRKRGIDGKSLDIVAFYAFPQIRAVARNLSPICARRINIVHHGDAVVDQTKIVDESANSGIARF